MSFRAGKVCGRATRPAFGFAPPLGATVLAVLLAWPAGAQQEAAQGLELSPAAVQQIEALLAEKAQRTPAQRKVSSHLLYAERSQRGEPIAEGVVLRQSSIDVESDGMVTVDIQADVTPALLARINALGGSVISSVPKYRAVRARLPLAAMESLAELEEVQSIRPADRAVTRGQTRTFQAAVRADARDSTVTRKVNTSEGDIAHQADRARQQFGVDGSGIGIGVLSDGVDSLTARQVSGDLPASVTVLPGQARPPIGANLFTPPAPAAARSNRSTRRAATAVAVAALQARRRSFASR